MMPIEKQISKIIWDVAKKLQENSNITIEELLDYLGVTNPHKDFRTGGFLFRHWLLCYGPRTLRLEYLKITENRALTPLESEGILSRCHVKRNFFSFLKTAAFTSSQKKNKQFLSDQLVLRGRGLSRTGHRLLSQSLPQPSLSTHETQRDTLLEEADKTIRELVANGNVVVWMDNFNKYYFKQIYSDGDYMLDVKLTAVGVVVVPPHLDLTLKYKSDVIIPGYPRRINDLFGPRVAKVIEDVGKTNVSQPFKNGQVVTQGIKNFPLKNTKTLSKTSKSLDGLENFHRVGMWDADIGCNDGLLDDLKRLVSMLNQEKYNLVIVDVGIYQRVLKVILLL
jgi:hypothetical protein